MVGIVSNKDILDEYGHRFVFVGLVAVIALIICYISILTYMIYFGVVSCCAMT